MSQKLYELIEWWDISTGPNMEDYEIEEETIGLFTTIELAKQKIKEINNDMRKFFIRERDVIK